MEMTHEEIYNSWREAKDPAAQIGILADINCCSACQIEQIIESYKLKNPRALPPVVEAAKKPRGRHATLDDWEKEKILELYRSGKSEYSISLAVGRSKTAVRNVIDKEGLNMQTKKIVPRDKPSEATPKKDAATDSLVTENAGSAELASKPGAAEIAGALLYMLASEFKGYTVSVETADGCYIVDVQSENDGATLRKRVQRDD